MIFIQRFFFRRKAKKITKYIEDPGAFLRSMFPGKSVSRIGGCSLKENVFPYYIINEKNACSIYGSAALAYFAKGGEAGFEEIKKQSLEIAKEMGFTGIKDGTVNYYIDLLEMQPFQDAVFERFGLQRKLSNKYFRSWRIGRSEIDSGRPFMLNIWFSGEYYDHSVTAWGYEEYSVEGRVFRFFKVKDGYARIPRYVAMEGVIGSGVSIIA